MNPRLSVAIISTLGVVTAAYITARATVASSSGNLERLHSQGQEIEAQLRTLNVPVGTIVASMLDRGVFAEASGDPSVFDPKVSKWVKTDGKTDIHGSRYSEVTLQDHPPNLQGMFLRGIGETENRKPGDVQDDATRLPRKGFATSDAGAHNHSIPAGGNDEGWGHAEVGGGGPGSIVIGDAGQHAHQVVGGDEETRPINVGVYYYLRINDERPAK